MFMDPPITHPLTILIRQSTRTSECQLVPYTGSIAGHICVLAGGGEDAVVVSSLARSESFRCRLKVVTDCHPSRYRSGSPGRCLRGLGLLPGADEVAGRECSTAKICASTSKRRRRHARIAADRVASSSWAGSSPLSSARRGRETSAGICWVGFVADL